MTQELPLNKNICICAGAGTGKTHSLTERFLQLIEEGKEVEEIVAITFTEKAATDMLRKIKEKVEEKIKKELEEGGNKWSKIWLLLPRANITTIHSFCMRLLKENAVDIGIDPDFEILTTEERNIFLEKLIQDKLLQLVKKRDNRLTELLKTKDFPDIIKIIKDTIIEVRKIGKRIQDFEEPEKEDEKLLYSLAIDVEKMFEEKKKEAGFLDYDDLLIYTEKMLREEKDIRQKYKKKFSAILVDEFQDTNDIQRKIIYYLCEDLNYCAADANNLKLAEGKLFVVGDRKQSIYSFRGADLHVFERVKEDIEKQGGVIVNLQENWRSNKTIIDFVNDFSPYLFKNFEEKEKLIAVREETPPSVEILRIKIGDANSTEKRKITARAIVSRICELLENGKKPEDIAILFPTIRGVNFFEEQLKQKGIPYYLVRGMGFYGCQEIKDILCMLKLLENEYDEIALYGVLRSPMIGMEDKDIYEMRKKSDKYLIELVKKSSHPLCKKFTEILKTLKEIRDNVKIFELLEEIFRLTDYDKIVLSMHQGLQKYANLQKLKEIAREFERKRLNTLFDFTRHLEYLIEAEPKEPEAQSTLEEQKAVKIMTVHQAKGLEFDTVILGDTAWQPKGSGTKQIFKMDKASEEERKRLLYVAITRAKNYLIIPYFVDENLNPKNYGKGKKWWNEIKSYFEKEENIKKVIVKDFETEKEFKFEKKIELPQTIKIKEKKPELKVLSVNATELAKFMFCEKYYYFEEVLKPGYKFNSKSHPEIAGQIMHKIVMEKEPEKVMDAEIEANLLNRTEKEKLLKISKEFLKKFGKFLEKYNVKDYEFEYPFFVSIEHNSKVFYVKGKMDFIGNGDTLIICDFKYAKKKDLAKICEYENQLKIYSLPFFDKKPKLFLFFILEENPLYEVKYDNTDLKKIKESLVRFLLCKEQNLWHQTGRCKICKYKKICKNYQLTIF